MKAAQRQPGIAVWDPLVRILHWGLAMGIALAWITRHGGGKWHEWIGYAVLAIVASRFVWGGVGPRYARFAQFVHAPATTLAYARSMIERREPRHVGHNPLGGWMIASLLAVAGLAAASGWLYVTDAYWGVEWVGNLHEFSAVLLLVLVALHVAGVAIASWRHHENLVAAMVHGRKRPAGPDDC